MVSALTAKLAKVSAPTAEQGERETKYATALDAAQRFMDLADANEGSVGPIEGRGTQARGEFGLGSEAEGEMRALEATMKTRLGTALSGAAIPATEWPTYQAQLPGMTDTPEVRRGKMKALEETIAFLERRSAQLRGQNPNAGPGGMSIDWEATALADEATTTPAPEPNVINWTELK